jgi:cystathionine beta-lyase/cystathionine gamma-synthase
LTLGERLRRLPNTRIDGILHPYLLNGIHTVSHTSTDRAGAAKGFASQAVHAGERAPHRNVISTSTPIYLTSSFIYDDLDDLDAVFGNEQPGFVYTRYGNPTFKALEAAVAALEGTDDAIAYASGMGALHAAILNEVQTGSRIVASKDLYGATATLLTNLFATLGVKTIFVDMIDLDAVAAAVEESKPRVVLLETISNPLLHIPDMPAVAEIARGARATLIVDNTFASPMLVNPIKHGAHTVVHSSTKYLGGHGDVTGGIVATDAERSLEIREVTKLTGAIPGPFEAWLTLRGIKTLPLRVRKQSENAAKVANWLSNDGRIARVHYPGLKATPTIFNNELRGGMISFEIADGCRERIFRLMESLRLCLPAVSLGDVYSLVLYPPISTHRGLAPHELAAMGISEGFVRMSVGIEDVEDIIEDLDGALAAACA